ncbi:MAG: hypothetical protein HC812_18010 [Leptolyngbya sp. RL_3_1]|nr:hypothetical protein [Leptolyngbya sp. RL_3_1]
MPKATASRIASTKLTLRGIGFSFKYYQNNHRKFSANEKTTAYWLTLMERLKAISGLSKQELLVNRSQTLRCHPIKWEDTSESGFGLSNEEQLVDTPYQFSLSSNEHGRVHGFFIDEIFYIVWLDADHLLYSAQA